MADEPSRMPVPSSLWREGKVDMGKANAWFRSHWRGIVTCQVCKTSEWTIRPYLALLVWNPISIEPLPTASVMVECKDCGHILMFNAEHMGLLDG